MRTKPIWTRRNYEQLQYVGDTRIQALISYAVTGDDRLARQAIEAVANSRLPEGLTQSRYPSSVEQVIPPFSLYWIGMLDDFYWYRPDTKIIAANLQGTRGVLAWFFRYLQPDGLLREPPYWNFVDWVPKGPSSRAIAALTRTPGARTPPMTCLPSWAASHPSAPGFATVRISPALAAVRNLTIRYPHPLGEIVAHYESTGRPLHATITLPPGLHGTFEWQGTTRSLEPGATTFTVEPAMEGRRTQAQNARAR